MFAEIHRHCDQLESRWKVSGRRGCCRSGMDGRCGICGITGIGFVRGIISNSRNYIFASSTGGRNARQGSARPPAQTTTLTLCNFHKKFGDAARKLPPACSRWGEERSRNSQATKVFHIGKTLMARTQALVQQLRKMSKSVAERGRNNQTSTCPTRPHHRRAFQEALSFGYRVLGLTLASLIIDLEVINVAISFNRREWHSYQGVRQTT